MAALIIARGIIEVQSKVAVLRIKEYYEDKEVTADRIADFSLSRHRLAYARCFPEGVLRNVRRLPSRRFLASLHGALRSVSPDT